MISVIRKSFAALSIVALFSACSASKNAVAIPTRENVKGNWTLNTVTLDGVSASERVKVNLLDEGSEECLQGSTWAIPNNGYGSYTINSNGAGCIGGQKNIIWSYAKEGDRAIFQFKKLAGGVSAKDVTDGYRFTILSADKFTMSLQSDITYMGSALRIVYSFSKQ